MNIDRDIIQILAGWSLILLFGVLLVVLQQCSVFKCLMAVPSARS